MICEICLFENIISQNSKMDDQKSNVNFYTKDVDI